MSHKWFGWVENFTIIEFLKNKSENNEFNFPFYPGRVRNNEHKNIWNSFSLIHSNYWTKQIISNVISLATEENLMMLIYWYWQKVKYILSIPRNASPQAIVHTEFLKYKLIVKNTSN